MGRRYESVYSVVSVDITYEVPVDVNVAGSYRDRSSAATACADYIMERMELRDDIRYALGHDIRHPDLKKMLSRAARVSARRIGSIFRPGTYDCCSMPDEVRYALRSYLEQEIMSRSGYSIETEINSSIGCDTFMFMVQENQLS